MARLKVILFFAVLIVCGDIVTTSLLDFHSKSSWQNANVAWARGTSESSDSNPILSLQYPEIGFPAYTKPALQKDTALEIENTGNVDLTYTVTKFETTGPADWLTFLGFTSPIAPGSSNSVTGTIRLNTGGVSNPPYKEVLTGGLVFTSNAPTSPDTLPILFTIADTVAPPSLDTLFIRQAGTAKLALIVSSNGNFGNQGQGAVNLDYDIYGDCDTAAADVYLYDGSAVIGWVSGSDTIVNWSIFGDSWLEDSTALRPYTGLPDSTKWMPRFRDCPNFEYYRTARFVTRDTAISMEKRWYAPKTGVAGDSLFIIQCLRIWLTSVGSPRMGVTVGEVIDWNIPSDSGADNSSATSLNQEIWQRGVDYAGDTTWCQPNSNRFGGMRYLYRYTNALKNDSAAFSAYTAENDSFVSPNNGLVATELYRNFSTPGFATSDSVEDLHMGMCFRHNFTMNNTDTLRFYTVLATVRNGTQADLQNRFARGKSWFNGRNIANIPRDSCSQGTCCCVGIRGDVNSNGALSVLDLNFLIAYMFASGPAPPCFQEADMNATNSLNILDINVMVAYFFSGGPSPAVCGC